jgi:microcystin-dependent protein
MIPFVGEVKPFIYQFAPEDWLLCDGSEYKSSAYPALFSIIGNIYGGTTNRTFKVPNLAGLAVAGAVAPDRLGAKYGSESVVLTEDQMPTHNHLLQVQIPKPASAQSDTSSAPSAASDWLAHPQIIASATQTKLMSAYATMGSQIAPSNLHPNTLANSGGGLAHENRQPYLAMEFYISVTGDYPVRP